MGIDAKVLTDRPTQDSLHPSKQTSRAMPSD